MLHLEENVLEAADWQRIEELGQGGQSSVWLVRSPERGSQLDISSLVISQALAGTSTTDAFAKAMAERMRPDRTEELGALKIFDKVREGGTAPTDRIKREIEILREEYAGLPKLLDSNADEKWMITELFPEGSLDKSPKRFEGDVNRRAHGVQITC
jgi:serine/threonine protein kinase